MIIKLPNGLLDGSDLFDHAEIDELKGKQQNYLANRELVVGNIGHIPRILSDLVLSLQTKEGLEWKGSMKEAVYKLPAGDLETLLIKIRENTFGPRFYFEGECPHCEALNKDIRLDLDKLDLDKMTAKQMLDSKKRTFKLPKSGKEVELKPIYLKDLFEVVKITTSKHDQLITSVIALSIKRYGDKVDIKPTDIEDMPSVDINFLREKVDSTKLEGSIDTDITHTCEKCSTDFDMKLNVYEPDFFDHSKGSTSTTT